MASRADQLLQAIPVVAVARSCFCGVAAYVAKWLAIPSVTDWLNVGVVFALLIVTSRYARSTDQIVKANQEMLEATRGILAETARQATAASQAAGIAFEQWRQVRRDVLISIRAAVRECTRHIDNARVQLENTMETGADDADLCANFVLPAFFIHALERARYVSSDVYEDLRSAEGFLTAACKRIEQATNDAKFADLKPAKQDAERALLVFGSAAEKLESLLRECQ